LRKLVTIFLILAMLGLGTGIIELLHNLDHHDTEATHDKSDCDFHCLLRAPLAASTSTPHLATVGELLSVSDIVSASLISQHTPARIDCRGPPTC
jgi:hypothetical protein